MSQPAPDPREHRPDLASEVARALLRSLEKDPDERFSSAGEFVSAMKA